MGGGGLDTSFQGSRAAHRSRNQTTARERNSRTAVERKEITQQTKTHMEKWVQHKYQVTFKATLLNVFLSDMLKERIFAIIEKTQRAYFALKRFLQICRFKTTHLKIDTDLCLNPIDHLTAFTIIQNGGKYMFTVRDILNLTMTALTNSHDFFAEPRFPKNPYTNIRFTKTDMYNIYFRVVASRLITPPLLTECFLNHFELDNFLIDNEPKLRNHSIRNYVVNSPHTILYSEVMYMIRRMFKGKQVVERRTKIPNTGKYKTVRSTVLVAIEIHPEFPRDVLVDVMRPYLYLYLLFHDHIHGTEKKAIASSLLKREVQRFLKYNHGFGRKQINASIHGNPFAAGSQNRVFTSSFNDKHEIFTVQQADAMFNTKVLLQKNVGYDSSGSSSDDDSVDGGRGVDNESVEEAVGMGVGVGTNEISAVVGSEFRNSYSESSFLSPQSSFVSQSSTQFSFDFNISDGSGAMRYAEHPVRRVNAVLRNRSGPGGHSVFRSALLEDYIGLAVIYNDWDVIPPFDELGMGSGDLGYVSDSDAHGDGDVHVVHPLPLNGGFDSLYEPGEVVSEDGLPQDSVTFLEYNSDNESTGYDSN